MKNVERLEAIADTLEREARALQSPWKLVLIGSDGVQQELLVGITDINSENLHVYTQTGDVVDQYQIMELIVEAIHGKRG